MRTLSANVFLAAIFLGASSACFARVAIWDRGAWPASWPKELECYRGQSKTFEVMHGIHEDVHEIRFRDRADFKRAWPYLLQLKTPGAPVMLEPSPSTYSVSGSTAEEGVRILCPPRCDGGVSENEAPDTSQNWLDSIKVPSGKMPEYVVRKDGQWAAYDGTNRVETLHRARVDLVLIVDGTIIDLDFMVLPANTPIIDNRLKQGPRYSAFVTCFNGPADCENFCSASAAGINTKPEGKLTCGHPEKASEIAWQFVKRQDKADVYQFARRFPVDKLESTTEQKTIEYAGDRVIVFQDEFQVIVIQALEPEKPAK